MAIILKIIFAIHIFFMFTCLANADINQDVKDLKKEFEQIKDVYQKKIKELETKIAELEANKNQKHQESFKEHDDHNEHTKENNFNIEAVLNAKYSSYSLSGEAAIKGFGVAHEGERGKEGLAIGETELIINSDIGEKFTGSVTAAIVREDGADKIELEEAYIESLNGTSFINNTFFKLGRAFWNVAALNPQHSHADDFADRPLPYRVFLNKAYNDDGFEASYLLPNSSELGFGIYRGEDFPFGNTAATEGQGSDAWSAYYKSDLNISNTEELAFNLYHLSGKSRGLNARISTEDNVTFKGDSDLSVINIDYLNLYGPGRKLKVNTEYFYRNQDGTFEDAEESTGEVNFDDNDSGYYISVVNQFNKNLSLGIRYSEMLPADVPSGLEGSALDSGNNDPEAYSVMSEWKFDSAAVMRLQLNHEKPQANTVDNQIMFQYIMYLGSSGHDGHDH